MHFPALAICALMQNTTTNKAVLMMIRVVRAMNVSWVKWERDRFLSGWMIYPFLDEGNQFFMRAVTSDL
jgi:hypothetical protein